MNQQPKISYCEGCSTEITWGTWRASGKRMCAHEDPEGNLILVDGFWQFVRAGANLFPKHTLYTSHFATCPKAAQFRK